MIVLYRLFSPLLICIYHVLAETVFSGKLRETWQIRWVVTNGKREHAFKSVNRALFAKRPIWIHAASGEFEYAKSVIRTLVAQGETEIVVSYFSPTYAENIRRFPGVKASFPLPFDRLDWMAELITHLSPRCLLIARTDAWPMLIEACNNANVPTLLFSATFHAGSKRMAPWARALTAQTLSKISKIHCVAKEDAELLHRLGVQTNGPERIQVAGDSRYDQVLARLENPKPIPEELRTRLRPSVFVAGSIWDEDIPAIVEASIGSITGKDGQNGCANRLTTVLVPHEPTEEHLRFIETRLRGLRSQTGQLTFQRLSSLLRTPSDSTLDFVLVDSVGLLAELYTLGQIAFVGGSFRGSVHSVMEPLAAGCITLVGPDHLNNREAIEFQLVRISENGCTAVLAAQSVAQLRDRLQLALETLKTASETKATIQNEVRTRGGATTAVVRWLNELQALRR